MESELKIKSQRGFQKLVVFHTATLCSKNQLSIEKKMLD